tara:strand:- start:1726 stop:3663 length:1938 start_codon:yes stop_codon:yes gene_type:complete
MAQNLVLNILAKDKTKQAFNGIRAGLTNLRSAVFSVQSALIGIGGGLVVRSLLKTGMEVENLAVRFNFLFGNAKEGAKAFQNLTKFAAKVPFSLEEISQASGNLAVVAKDAEDLTRILKITGNVASVTGLDFALTATQIQRAFSGGIAAADVFRERGVRALLGFKMGATVSVEETIEAFEKTFGENGRFAKATEVLSTTMTGTLSMLGDKLFKFKTETNQAGFFDFVKQGLADINNIMEANEAVLNNLAIRISEFMIKTVKNVLIGGAVLMDTLKPVFKLVGVAMEGIIQSVKALPSGIRELGIIGFLMLGGKGKLLVVLIMSTIDIIRSALGTVLETYANLMDKVNAGMRTLKLISQETFEANLLTFDKMFATAQKLKTPLKAIKQTGEDSADSWGEAETAIRNFLTNLEINAKISKAQYNEMMSILEASKEEAEKMGVSLQKIRETTLENFKKDFESINTTLAKMVQSGIKAFSRGLAEAVIMGKELNMTMKEIAQRILVDVLAFTIQIVIQEAIRSAFKKDQVKSEEKVTHELKKQTKEIKKQAAIKAVGSFFGIPMMNTGGAVSKGKPVVVGERGAEMFIPNSSGQITQSARGTGGGTVNVNFNIEAIDSNSFNSVLVENRGIITSIINNALNEKGKRELI